MESWQAFLFGLPAGFAVAQAIRAYYADPEGARPQVAEGGHVVQDIRTPFYDVAVVDRATLVEFAQGHRGLCEFLGAWSEEGELRFAVLIDGPSVPPSLPGAQLRGASPGDGGPSSLATPGAPRGALGPAGGASGTPPADASAGGPSSRRRA